MSESVSKGRERARSGVTNATLDRTELKIAVTRQRKSAANARRDQIRATVALLENLKRPCATTICINCVIAIPG